MGRAFQSRREEIMSPRCQQLVYASATLFYMQLDCYFEHGGCKGIVEEKVALWSSGYLLSSQKSSSVCATYAALFLTHTEIGDSMLRQKRR